MKPSTIIVKTKYYLNTCPKCGERLTIFQSQDSKECKTCAYYRHWEERFWTQKDYLDFYRKNKIKVEKVYELNKELLGYQTIKQKKRATILRKVEASSK